MRITLSDKVIKLIGKLKQDHADRGIKKEVWEQMLSEALLTHSAEFWRQKIEEHTPENYLIDQALKDPKQARELMEFLRTKKQNPSDSTKPMAAQG